MIKVEGPIVNVHVHMYISAALSSVHAPQCACTSMIINVNTLSCVPRCQLKCSYICHKIKILVTRQLLCRGLMGGGGGGGGGTS